MIGFKYHQNGDILWFVFKDGVVAASEVMYVRRDGDACQVEFKSGQMARFEPIPDEELQAIKSEMDAVNKPKLTA